MMNERVSFRLLNALGITCLLVTFTLFAEKPQIDKKLPAHHIQKTDSGDWIYSLDKKLDVEPLTLMQYAVRMNLRGYHPDAHFFICLRLKNKNGNILSSMYAPLMPEYETQKWQTVKGTCVVPYETSSMELIISGRQTCDILVASCMLEKVPDKTITIQPSAKKLCTLSNSCIQLQIDPKEWSFTITDARNGKIWQTYPAGAQIEVMNIRAKTPRIADVHAVYVPAAAPLKMRITLAQNDPEFSLNIEMPKDTPMPIWAAPLEVNPALHIEGPEAGVVLPYGEGFFFPAQKNDGLALMMQLGDGGGMTMPWAGVADLTSGAAAMWFTHDDTDGLARYYFWDTGVGKGKRLKGNTVVLSWLSEKCQWGYNRKIHYWFANKGGYVALAKRYRESAKKEGKLVTLAEKEKKIPDLKRFRGAPIGWFNFLYHIQGQDKRMEEMKWLRDQGIKRMMFSSGETIDDLKQLQKWGWLTTSYEQFGGVWLPEDAPKAHIGQKYTFTKPKDISVKFNNRLRRGWVQRTEHGEFPSYEMCNLRQIDWGKKIMKEKHKDGDYNGQFIDTTTALPFYECYSKDHPATRRQDKKARQELMGYVGEQGMICGSEIGCDWAVPYVCYGEGMLSPIHFRHPRAGELPPDLEPVENTYRYQLNPRVRIPLWELVYHDCHVAFWYWGDTQSTFPSLWAKRNLFNALYATPALYMIMYPDQWEKYKNRVVETEKQLAPVLDAADWQEMTDHEFVTPDRLVQTTRFADGTRIVVNFSEREQLYKDTKIAPTNFVVITKQ